MNERRLPSRFATRIDMTRITRRLVIQNSTIVKSDMAEKKSYQQILISSGNGATSATKISTSWTLAAPHPAPMPPAASGASASIIMLCDNLSQIPQFVFFGSCHWQWERGCCEGASFAWPENISDRSCNDQVILHLAHVAHYCMDNAYIIFEIVF